MLIERRIDLEAHVNLGDLDFGFEHLQALFCDFDGMDWL